MTSLLTSKLSGIRFCCFHDEKNTNCTQKCSFFKVIHTHTEPVLLWTAAIGVLANSCWQHYRLARLILISMWTRPYVCRSLHHSHTTLHWLPVWMTNHPPSVLWHCWLGYQTCKNRRPYNLYCVGADVKPCSINQSLHWLRRPSRHHHSLLLDPMWARKRCRISTPHFLAECHMKRLNQASFVLLRLHCLLFLGCV